MRQTASRYHDFSYGHRVHNHESKCQHLHGHNGRVHFECEGLLDDIGRVIDFGVIKAKLCMWLEDNWDHHFLVWEGDPMADELVKVDPTVVKVPFNPTAENMSSHLLNTVAPAVLVDTGVTLIKVVFEETQKCLATSSLS